VETVTWLRLQPWISIGVLRHIVDRSYMVMSSARGGSLLSTRPATSSAAPYDISSL
jgi:hypothetical protein